MSSPQRFRGSSLIVAALVSINCLLPLPIAAADDPSAAAIQQIVETFARSAVDDGAAVGVSVGVTFRGRTPQFFAYGLANFGERTLVTPDTIFEIGSVTKVFTTALLGWNVHTGVNKLNEPLSRFSDLVGFMRRPTQGVNLRELGDFTAAFPSTPPLCSDSPATPGCLPNGRPTIGEYGAQDLLDYFRSFVAPHLPAPYNYSDISTGLIGLILGSRRNAPMDNTAVEGWLDLVSQRITGPLGMNDTFLIATPNQQPRLAAGYAQALAKATVADDGKVTGISLVSPGFGYSGTPAVRIVGGGGADAVALAIVDGSGGVKGIDVTTPGQGYVAPPVVEFGGNPTDAAKASAVVSDGRVVGIRITARGSGYSVKHPPTVTITGGTQGPGAQPAVLAPANISNGSVDFVRVLDGGQGYVDPIAVIVEPGNPLHNAVPIWAPASALKSSARDLLKFAEAALRHRFVDGVAVDSRLRAGFEVAQMSYACETPRPCLRFSGLAWAITPADGGMGKVISKNGGIAGFSTQIGLVPSLDLGVVVFVNSRQNLIETGKPDADAARILNNILSAIARESGFDEERSPHERGLTRPVLEREGKRGKRPSWNLMARRGQVEAGPPKPDAAPRPASSRTLLMMSTRLRADSVYASKKSTSTSVKCDSPLSSAATPTGIAHKQAGMGQIGAAIVRAPMACFTQTLGAPNSIGTAAVSQRASAGRPPLGQSFFFPAKSGRGCVVKYAATSYASWSVNVPALPSGIFV